MLHEATSSREHWPSAQGVFSIGSEAFGQAKPAGHGRLDRAAM